MPLCQQTFQWPWIPPGSFLWGHQALVLVPTHCQCLLRQVSVYFDARFRKPDPHTACWFSCEVGWALMAPVCLCTRLMCPTVRSCWIPPTCSQNCTAWSPRHLLELPLGGLCLQLCPRGWAAAAPLPQRRFPTSRNRTAHLEPKIHPGLVPFSGLFGDFWRGGGRWAAFMKISSKAATITYFLLVWHLPPTPQARLASHLQPIQTRWNQVQNLVFQI